MDLLSKFSSIEIKPDARISETDRTFGQAHQAAYDAARASLQELEFFWEDMQRQQQEALASTGNVPSESYLTTYGKLRLSERDIQEQRRSLHPAFIDRLASYFSSAYHLTIQTEDIKDNLLPHKPYHSSPQEYRPQMEEYTAAMDSLSLHYTEILEQIFLQTGGRELAESAVCELKEKCRRAAWDSAGSKARFTLKKASLQLDFACCYRLHYQNYGAWEIFQRAVDILKGIAYFEAEGFSGIPDSLAQALHSGDHSKNCFTFPGCVKVQSMKLYKNHRIDIKFHTEEHARKFVEEYLGTVPPY